jgi:hypothetical protein
MKKTYFAPATEMLNMNVELPLAGSGTPVQGGGIGFGGKDDGTNVPGVKENIFEENSFAANPFE